MTVNLEAIYQGLSKIDEHIEDIQEKMHDLERNQKDLISMERLGAFKEEVYDRNARQIKEAIEALTTTLVERMGAERSATLSELEKRLLEFETRMSESRKKDLEHYRREVFPKDIDDRFEYNRTHFWKAIQQRLAPISIIAGLVGAAWGAYVTLTYGPGMGG